MVLLVTASTCFAQDIFKMGARLNSDIYRERLQQQRQRDLEAEQYRIDHLPASEAGRIFQGRGVSANDPQFKRFWGKVEATYENGSVVIVSGGFGTYTGEFALINYPHRIYRGLNLDKTNALNAVPVGEYIYRDGPGVPKLDYGQLYVPPPLAPTDREKKSANLAKSFKYWSELAAAGDAQAEYMLGEKYRLGEGVAKDLPKAREWLAKSAAQGFHDAQTSLSSLSP